MHLYAYHGYSVALVAAFEIREQHGIQLALQMQHGIQLGSNAQLEIRVERDELGAQFAV